MNLQKTFIIVVILILSNFNSFADSFPCVGQFEFQDSIVWIRTNEGLYKILFSENGKIKLDKISRAGSGKFYIDSKNNVWIANFGRNLQIFKETELITIENDTTEYISNFLEVDSMVYIVTSINDEQKTFKYTHGSFKLIESKIKSNNYYRNFIYEVDKIKIEMLNNEIIETNDYDYDSNGNLYFLIESSYKYVDKENNTGRRTKKQKINIDGIFYKRINNTFIKVANYPNTNEFRGFSISNNGKIWVGGCSYIAFYDNGNWIELSFLEKLEHHCGPEDEIEYNSNRDNGKIGYISDTDGYANIRENPNFKSKVVCKILDGTSINYWDFNSEWYKVVTNSGVTKGFIHKSRIQK